MSISSRNYLEYSKNQDYQEEYSSISMDQIQEMFKDFEIKQVCFCWSDEIAKDWMCYDCWKHNWDYWKWDVVPMDSYDY